MSNNHGSLQVGEWPEVTPLPVKIVEYPAQAPVKVPRVETRYETFVLTSNDPAQCILPEDTNRICAYVQAIDTDIVLGQSRAMVANPVNTVASVPTPFGAYIPKANTAPTRIEDSNAVFAGLTSSTSTRVTVIASYNA